MRVERDDDLARPRRGDEAAHDLVERLVADHAGEDDVGLCAHLGDARGARAPELFELRERAAPIADDRVAVLEQTGADRKPDLADADESDLFHAQAPGSDGALFDVGGAVGEAHRQAQGAFHHGPRLDGERADAVDDERIAERDPARLCFARGAHDRHAVPARAVAERTLKYATPEELSYRVAD